MTENTFSGKEEMSVVIPRGHKWRPYYPLISILKFWYRFFIILCCVLAEVFNAKAQNNLNVSGIVRDAKTNDPLIGATITVKERTTGTITDKNGSFKLNVPLKNDSARLLISYVGYRTNEVTITLASV